MREEEEEVKEERKGGGVGERDTPGRVGVSGENVCVSVCLGAVLRKEGIPSSGLTRGPIPPNC